jgi:hypothetical protein
MIEAWQGWASGDTSLAKPQYIVSVRFTRGPRIAKITSKLHLSSTLEQGFDISTETLRLGFNSLNDTQYNQTMPCSSLSSTLYIKGFASSSS